MANLVLRTIFLTKDEFDRDLDINLVIKKYPNRMRKYYICEYTNKLGEKTDIKVNIKK